MKANIALSRIVASVLWIVLSAPAVAAESKAFKLAGEVKNRDGEIVMSFSSVVVEGKSLPIEQTKEIPYLSNRTMKHEDGKVTLEPASLTTGMSLLLKPVTKEDGVTSIDLTGAEIKFLGFQNYPNLHGAQKPLYTKAEYSAGGDVEGHKAVIPFGTFETVNSKAQNFEYILTVNVDPA